MSTRMFSEDQLERLRSFPDIGRDDLIRYFTLTPADVAFIDPGRGRGPSDRLGLAVQLSTLPWLGFVPDEVRSAPRVAVARLAERLDVDPGVLEEYGQREQTRSDHLRLVAGYLGWKNAPAGSMAIKELEQFLLDRAMEHDSPTLLFNLATEYLMASKTIRPGMTTLAKMVATARTSATSLTWEKVAHLLTDQLRADLDRLLVYDAGLKTTRLAWLIKAATDATATSVKTAIDKLTYLRNMDVHTLDVSMLAAERRRFLASVGRRSTNQALERRDERRRYPILLAVVAQSAVDQVDEVVILFDQAVSARESRAKTKTDEALIERAKAGEARQLLLEVILPLLADPSIPDEQIGALLRNRIGMGKLREVVADGWKRLPRDHGRLSALHASYTYLRQFTPQVLAAIHFQGGPGTADLMDAVAILKRLNDSGGRKVPEEAPTSFVPTRYAEYLDKARKSGDETAYRHYWELCVVLALRDGLRSGDIFVPGSRRYADPATYLYTDCWPDLLRMAGSLKYGQATASLVVGKWSAASRQNILAAALKEWGMLRRTLHAAKYLSDPAYRRKIARQLNKGESLHALRRDLHYAHQGAVTKPQLSDQTDQAWCLTVLTNAVIAWTTEYYSLAVRQLRAAGRDVPDELLAHISPAHSENVNFFGVITVDVEAELAKLDVGGWRPLRPAAADLSLL
ncbi:Tn3 family transposase (plasmid) [Sphaerimonospora sp. CA-214678]|uniref:Tn3 family transposase n=1 Tax=Sphaerimonospora sp. CA-214678 TaxID=3240029 RepID=UPI003D8C914A